MAGIRDNFLLGTIELARRKAKTDERNDHDQEGFCGGTFR